MNMEDCSPANTINVTDNEMASGLFYSSEEKRFMYIIIALIILTGMVGNGAFLLTVYRIQRMRSVTNAYLCNVAITDMTFIIGSSVFGYVLVIGSLKNELRLTTSVGCTLTYSVFNFTYFLSVTLITFVSLDRFYAICSPFSHRAVSSKSRTRRVIALAWVIAMILSIVMLPTIGRVTFQCIIWPNDQEIYYNLPDRRWICDVISNSVASRIYAGFVGAVIYAVFLVANVVMYAGIIRTLSGRDISTACGDQHMGEVKEVRNQVARLLIVSGIVFFICQSPKRLLNISRHMSKLGFEILSTEQHNFLRDMSVVFLNLNSVINPYLYVTLSKTYRDAFLEALNIKKEANNCSKRKKAATKEAIECKGRI